MASIKKNLIANFLGKIWTVIMSLFLLPYYIKIIGVEAYGIVGIYTALLSLFHVFDFGLSTTMNREMARMSSQNQPAEDFHHLTKSLETIYWSVALLIGILVIFMAPLIADHWVKAKELPSSTIVQAIICIGISLAFLWPSSLYSGGLMGLQKQVLLNGISVAMATARGIGMLVVLLFISPTIQAFFLWQMVINIAQTALMRFYLWKHLPDSSVSPQFDWSILKRLKSFVFGITGLTIVGVIYSQLDKVFLSRALTLDKFGYYTFAATIAGSLSHIVVPIYSVFFPAFSQHVSLNDQESLIETYHKGCQLMSAFILPTALLIIFYAPEILWLWTRNQETVANAATLTRLLMVAAMLSALLNLPCYLLFAHGRTKLNFYLNLSGLIGMLPLLLLGVYRFGATGAAGALVFMNALLLVLFIQLMHRRILPFEKRAWFFQDIGFPLLASLVILTISRFFFSKMGELSTIAFLVFTFILSLTGSLLASHYTRSRVMQYLKLGRLRGS